MKLDITEKTAPKLWKRLAWFGGIWLASVLALTLVALSIRVVLRL
ncbi:MULTISPECIES: DUF2474 family protein [Xanthobacteraceae]|nr:DUF2474 family protein [Labrys sp. ZIDIC5]MDZ5451443.1 DUF2474 family protein [Labrys sp. ZIDIC5]